MLLMKILILCQQLHILQLHKLPFTTAHFNITTAQIVINCTLKYALITLITDVLRWLPVTCHIQYAILPLVSRVQ